MGNTFVTVRITQKWLQIIYTVDSYLNFLYIYNYDVKQKKKIAIVQYWERLMKNLRGSLGKIKFK